MNIKDARSYALSLDCTTEDLFAENWLSYRVMGKWFMLLQLDAPEPRVAIKLPPEDGQMLRERHEGVTAAYHMNKVHWNDLYLQKLPNEFIKEQILNSYHTVVKHLPKVLRQEIENQQKNHD